MFQKLGFRAVRSLPLDASGVPVPSSAQDCGAMSMQMLLNTDLPTLFGHAYAGVSEECFADTKGRSFLNCYYLDSKLIGFCYACSAGNANFASKLQAVTSFRMCQDILRHACSAIVRLGAYSEVGHGEDIVGVDGLGPCGPALILFLRTAVNAESFSEDRATLVSAGQALRAG